MTLYILTEYERNMYHDSYFHAILFDSEKQEIVDKEIGATAYGGGCRYDDLHYPTVEILQQVANSRKAGLFESFKAEEQRRVFEFDTVETNQRVKLLTLVKSAQKMSIPCNRCAGTGKWTNPRNVCDKRSCFSCNGKGTCETKEKKKDSKGKVIYDTIPEGTAGKVLQTRAWGKFYRNGHNKPGRSNTTVLVEFDNGMTCWVSMQKLRLECEPASDVAIWEKANKYAESHSGFRADYKSYIRQLQSGSNTWIPGSAL